MKRYSSHTGHGAMAELNITPLLDLAFVLLIIFVITTPLVEQGINLTPPTSAPNPLNLDSADLTTVEIDRDGKLAIDGRALTLDSLEAELVRRRAANAQLGVGIRADKGIAYERVVEVIDLLQRLEVNRFGLVTQPAE